MSAWLVPVEQLATAPYPARPGPLGPDDLAALHRHYTGGSGAVAAPAAPDAGMVRHEERLRVGVQTVVTGRVVAALDRALVGEAALALEEQLLSLATALLALG